VAALRPRSLLINFLMGGSPVSRNSMLGTKGLALQWLGRSGINGTYDMVLGSHEDLSSQPDTPPVEIINTCV
jgi:hypothetical protein